MSVRDLKSTWENLGRTDPLWAVNSEPEHRFGAWDLDEFMATGREAVDYLLGVAGSHGRDIGERVLDFGCGVGRLSNVLCERGFRVTGVDIAASMVEQANALNAHPDRLDFVAYDGTELPFPDDSFDAAVSLVVLQHAGPREQVGALLQLQRVVAPGGLLIVQIPSRPRPIEPVAESGRHALIELLDVPAELPAGGNGVVRAKVTNIGEHTWPGRNQIKLANHWYVADDQLLVRDDGRTELLSDLAPGKSTELELAVVAPPTPGEYRIALDMVQELVAWWADHGSATPSHAVRVAGTATDSATDAPAEPEPSAAPPVGIQMHGMPTELVTALLSHCGHDVIAVVPDDWSGPEWESFTYLVRIGS